MQTYFLTTHILMAQGARDTGIGRENLYKARPVPKPRYDTVLKVLHALEVKLHVEPVQV
jgi:probable addiction module antidote protein